MVLVQRKEYNILVLGQTGVGKSTFINGLFNYMSFQNLCTALGAENAKYCIPTIYDLYDNNFLCHRVLIGVNEDKGEHQIIGQSATQNVKSYLFELGNIGIRIIDTPGFGDTAGTERDEKICENLVHFLSVREELRELHGVVFVFKPHDNRMTVFFKYCLNQIFSKLHKDASQNIAFVFTHTKGTYYKPGSTLTLLKNIVGNIPCSKENIFCIENDCIQYLLAKFYSNNTIELTDKDYELPWEKSSEECIRLINYVKGLTPHSVQDTIFINSARDYSVKLKAHLPSILDSINRGIEDCEKFKRSIDGCAENIQQLHNVLYKKTVTKREGEYHVVCRNPKCSKKKTHGKNKEACCPNCIAWKLSLCQKISLWKSQCKVCGCNEIDHVFESNTDYAGVNFEKNADVEENIRGKQEILNEKRIKLFESKINIKKFHAEKKFIEYWIGELSRYLEETSILSDQGTSEGANNNANEDIMSPQEIGKIVEILSNLEMTGEEISKLFDREGITVPEEKVLFIDQVPDNWKPIFEMTA